MSDISKPLHVKRTALIGRLKEVHAEGEAKKAEAKKTAAERRHKALTAVEQFDSDQLLNILFHHISFENDEAFVKWAEEKIEHGKFKTIETPLTGVETALERMIRVLELASDTEIEVAPSDSLYSYL